MQKIRVGVLMGGTSIEREVSFNSGRTICDHLDTYYYDIIPLFHGINNELFILPWRFLHRGKIADFEKRLTSETEQISWDDLKNRIDFMYIATHGQYAEDGTLQGFLEILNIPYFGSKVLGSALSMDKNIQKKLLSKHGITVPRGIQIQPTSAKTMTDSTDQIENILKQFSENNISFPVVVKPNKEGSSLGVAVIKRSEDLWSAIIAARDINPEKEQLVLIEEKIEGMEFSCITITDPQTGGWIRLPPTEVECEAGTDMHNYEQKYMPGRATKYTPARCSAAMNKKIQDTCIRVMEILQLTNMSRIDGFLQTDGTVVIVDPNSFTGTAPSSFFFNQTAAIGMNHAAVINHLIKTELKAYGMDKTDEFDTKKQLAEEIKKIRIAVLFGGDTNEKETSLDSGRNICYKLSPHKYKVTPLFVDKKFELYPLPQQILVHNTTEEIERTVDRSTKIQWQDLPKIADFIFIGLHGGRGENGCVQGTLEFLGLPYNGPSIIASATAMDKYKTNELLALHGIDVPKNLFVQPEEWKINKKEIIQKIIHRIQLPFIVKPHNDGCSFLVQKVSTKIELETAIEHIFHTGGTGALIEEYIVGMELTVGVIGNDDPQVLPPSYSLKTSDILSLEEKFLPGAGENQTPAPLSEKALLLVKDTVKKAYQTVGCVGYSRIDCFYQTKEQSPTKKERVVILEINTLPALTPATCLFHQAAEIGIKPMDFIDMIVTLGFDYHKKIRPTKQMNPSIKKQSSLLLKKSREKQKI